MGADTRHQRKGANDFANANEHSADAEAGIWRLVRTYQLLHRAGDVLDGNVRIDAVLVEKIDVVCAEASQLVRYAPDVHSCF